MKIWVDADACPGPVRDIIIRAALKRSVQTVFVANKEIKLGDASCLSSVRVPPGPDEADQYIAANAQPGDLVISQDIPLAAQLLAQNAKVISPYGTIFTPANIGDRLATRNLLQEMRDLGMVSGGPQPFGDKEKRQFANAFDQTLSALLKE